ncbi:hypothetical protein BJF78_32110 [Pseudonocardia sp. CNS-139]|nr:hypothetical protein BJF78_32110 [Pseudonocardia sp. CNS-139]
MNDGNPQAPDDLLTDPEWNRPRPTNRVTVWLAAALLAAAGFLAGVLVNDASGTATAAGPGGAPFLTGGRAGPARPGPRRNRRRPRLRWWAPSRPSPTGR